MILIAVFHCVMDAGPDGEPKSFVGFLGSKIIISHVAPATSYYPLLDGGDDALTS